MPGSNLYPNTVSLPVLTMTEQGNGNAGASSVPTTMEQLEQVLKDATATNKRNSEALDEHGQRSDALLAQIGHLQQLVQSNHSGLSDEGEKARIAPGKLRSCIPWDSDTLVNYSGERSCSMRAIQTVLAYPACFLKRPCVPS